MYTMECTKKKREIDSEKKTKREKNTRKQRQNINGLILVKLLGQFFEIQQPEFVYIISDVYNTIQCKKEKKWWILLYDVLE